MNGLGPCEKGLWGMGSLSATLLPCEDTGSSPLEEAASNAILEVDNSPHPTIKSVRALI